MNRFRFSLEALLEVAQAERDACARAMAAADQECQRETELLGALRAAMRDAQRRSAQQLEALAELEGESAGGVIRNASAQADAAVIASTVAGERVVAQEHAVHEAQTEFEASKARLERSDSRVKSLEKMRDRAKSTWTRLQEKREEAQREDVEIMRWQANRGRAV